MEEKRGFGATSPAGDPWRNGQRNRLITGRFRVRVPEDPLGPYTLQEDVARDRGLTLAARAGIYADHSSTGERPGHVALATLGDHIKELVVLLSGR